MANGVSDRSVLYERHRVTVEKYAGDSTDPADLTETVERTIWTADGVQVTDPVLIADLDRRAAEKEKRAHGNHDSRT